MNATAAPTPAVAARTGATRPGRRNVRRRRFSAGYTIVEVQIAIILMLIALWGMGSHARIYNQLLAGIEQDNAIQGVVNVGVGRAILAVSSAGADAGPPPCEIRLLSIDTGGTYPVAQVQVRQRGL
jgi:hypothetical protein